MLHEIDRYFPIKSLLFTKRIIVHLEKSFLYLSNIRKEQKNTSPTRHKQKKHDETWRTTSLALEFSCSFITIDSVPERHFPTREILELFNEYSVKNNTNQFTQFVMFFLQFFPIFTISFTTFKQRTQSRINIR